MCVCLPTLYESGAGLHAHAVARRAQPTAPMARARRTAPMLALLLVLALCGCSLAADAPKSGQPSSAPKAATPAVSGSTITSAGAAQLQNAGDLAPAGACASDIKAFCKDTAPGEGRLAACLTKRVRAQRQGNVEGRKVGGKCQDELAAFKIDRSSHINKDIPLARACKDDVAKHCSKLSDTTSPGSVLACLRDKKNSLNKNCKAEVFRTQQEVSEDYRVDYKLYKLCKDDAKNLCDSAGPADVVDCLEAKRRDVSWECQNQLFRADKEAGEDIRLSVRLFNKCLNDYRKFCKDVEPGHMRVQECLEDNMDESAFSVACKQELEEVIAKRVADFRLDTPLRDACEDDLKDSCGTSLSDMDGDERLKASGLNCLQQYREELKSDACRREVLRRTQRTARDIRFDEVLADACTEDRVKLCNDVQAGSARVIRCLQDHRDELSQRCTAALFDHEVRMAESIDFQFPMKKACAWEISSFCKDVPSGHARVMRCLEEHIDNTDMSRECKAEVSRNMNRMAHDYRLNFRLENACKGDISKLCANVCSSQPGASCGGLVLHCLRDNQENITDQGCQDEVFYYELMEVSDFRNDVILAEACRNDVEAYCKDVEPGEGRVHSCLRYNKDKISEKCRNEEMKLAAIEYRDIRLRPKLNKLCSEEKAVYCKDVKPGKARVIKCLIENMAQPNFGEECKDELQSREDVMKSDYRYDAGVFSSCASDVDAFCAEAKSKLRGNATVLKCLVNNFKQETESCQSEMSRAVRLALWDYKPGAALTAACDSDVDDKCPRGRRSGSGGVFTIGVVGRCLSKALVQGERLAPKCRELVLVAAPKDARAYLESPDSGNALLQRIADMQAAAGLDQVLVDTYASSGSTVTVTGWVALVCIMSMVVVLVGGAFILFRRLSGADRSHTLYQHVKSGDA